MFDLPSPTRVQTPRGPIECVVAGEGPALLALHGGLGGCDQSWLLARALLADPRRHRVIAVSRPGYLGTPQRLAYTPEEQADLYPAVLDALGIARAAVAAVSAGGPSALQFALRHPRRCRALVLVSTVTGRFDVPREVIARLRATRLIASIPGLTALMRRRLARRPEEAGRRSIPDPELRARTLAHPEAGPLLRALSESVLDRLARRLPGTINDTARYAALTQPWRLADVAMPALVVHGTADRVVPFAHAQAVADAVPGAELLPLDGGDHVALFTHLDAIRARVASFLAAQG
jgi:pimeloyl-ACP methyl ester carboxylesterase